MFGVGYFWNGMSKEGFVEKIDDGQGIEGYYNAEILQSVRLSLNLQWIKSLLPSVDENTFMLSTRLQIVF